MGEMASKGKGGKSGKGGSAEPVMWKTKADLAAEHPAGSPSEADDDEWGQGQGVWSDKEPNDDNRSGVPRPPLMAPPPPLGMSVCPRPKGPPQPPGPPPPGLKPRIALPRPPS